MKYQKKTHINKDRRIIQKKDGLPRCYVCQGKLSDLIDLRQMKADGEEGTDFYNRLQRRITETIIRLPKHENSVIPLYRHAGSCEPGESKYLKSRLGQGFFKRMGLKEREEND